jgi:hypothetical protein
MFENRLASERLHLIGGPAREEKPGGLGTVRFVAKCKGNAPEVLEKAKETLKAVNENSLPEWPSIDRWRQILPAWFVNRCAPERSQEEAENWLTWWKSLTPAEQKKVLAEEEWSLSNWIYWFQPDNRQWYWWDGVPLDRNYVVIAVEVDAWPFAWGALRWLFRAAGADDLRSEE